MKKLAFLILLAACQPKPTVQTIPETGPTGKSAMVASAHPLATKVGVQIMKDGGNAFDAAVAVKFALSVVYPQAGNIGGGGFAVFRMANGSVGALDFREKAPLAASRDMYLDEVGEFTEDLSTIGHQAVGVPGSVAGMWELHQEYGKMEWQSLVQPAIDFAFEGFSLTKNGASILNHYQDEFIEANKYTPWMINKDGWKEGMTVIQRELTATLGFIRDSGRDGFYKGIVGDQLIKEMMRGNGIITQEDLDTYEPVWRDPVVSTYKGHKIIGMPPPSSGGIALAQLLYGAEKFDLGDLSHNSSEYINLMAELEKRVYADRTIHLGDMDFYDTPQSTLLSPNYLDERFDGIAMNSMTSSIEITNGVIPLKESEQTTHFSIVDSEGNAVSITTTLNGSMGSKVMVKGAGFLLNNEMDDFSAKPGSPNMFGLLGSEANAIEPGKRMLSSMTPTIVEKEGQLRIVAGTPGGSTIITSVFQTILNVIDYDMTMQDAVNAPRAHHQWMPDMLYIEKGRLSESLINELEQIGHEINERKYIGKMDCILVRDDATLEGGSDRMRGDSYSEGF
ncbi:MAG: gamma-glutamyltransferase [Cytophagales bacterium]|nr:gamma-glutamyltransferase [Cytophagales bacterium]